MAKQVVLTKKHKQALVELLLDPEADVGLNIRNDLREGGYVNFAFALTPKGKDEARYWADRAAEARAEKQVAQSGGKL